MPKAADLNAAVQSIIASEAFRPLGMGASSFVTPQEAARARS